MTTGFERVARKVYVAAQDYNFFKSRELKTQGKADRALNYVLGFNSHDDRLAYLHLQMSGQLAIKGQTLQGGETYYFKGLNSLSSIGSRLFFNPTTRDWLSLGLSKAEDILFGRDRQYYYFYQNDENPSRITTREERPAIGIQPGRSYFIKDKAELAARASAAEEIQALRGWYNWQPPFSSLLSKFLQTFVYEPKPKYQIELPTKVYNRAVFPKLGADEVLVRSIKDGRIDTSIYYRPMPTGLMHTRGLI